MTFARSDRGGTGTYARAMQAALGARDDVALEIIEAPRRGLLPTLDWLLRGARDRLDAQPVDLLHCPAVMAPWRAGVPYLVTIHDHSSKLFPADHPPEWRVYEGLVLPRRARAAERVLTGTEFARAELVADLGLDPARVVVTPYGVDPGFHRVAGRRPTLHHPDGPAKLLFPGAPTVRKNLGLVLTAMAEAHPDSRLSRAVLEISGADETGFQAHAQSIAALGLADRVRWLGQVPAGRMPEVVAAADAVVFPSLYEGFGFPAVEAMAAGTPVVASSAACLPEVIGDGGLLVDIEDAEGFRKALEGILDDPQRAEALGEAGRSRAARYTWERCAELTVEIYREVLATSR